MTALRKLLDDYHGTSGLVDHRGFHRLELLAPQLAEAIERGFALCRPDDGRFAWKDECDVN